MNPRIAIIGAAYDARLEIHAADSGRTILVISEDHTPEISRMTYIFKAAPKPVDPLPFDQFKKRRWRDTLPWNDRRRR